MNLSISTVFDELIATLENTIVSVKDAKSKSLILSEFDVEFVLNCVFNVTGVDKERILYGTDRNDERKMALALCIYFIRKEFLYSYSELQYILKKDKSGLSRYYSMIENLPKNPKTDFDKKLSSFIKKINLLITEKKNKK